MIRKPCSKHGGHNMKVEVESGGAFEAGWQLS
jgi:hypothetical protein